MLGLAVTLLLGLLVALGAARVFQRAVPNADQAEGIGVGGLLGLGAVGWLTFFPAIIPGGVRFVWLLWIPAVIGALFISIKHGTWRLNWRFPEKHTYRLFVLALALLSIIPIVAALAPSDAFDWDTLAYHLAVPKLWLASGSASYIPFIHQSNFPFVVENLYIHGLIWGGAAGAKAFTILFFVFGVLAVFGVARRRFGASAGYWAALAFAGAPLVLWESGTGYIDVANGLFAGLGLWYVFEAGAGALAVGSLLLGAACASKYTGLEVLFIAALLLALRALARREGVVHAVVGSAKLVGVGLALCSPWLVRNYLNTRNPVYPFAYGVFDGKNWDSWRAAIYSDEQQSFGVGRTSGIRDPMQLGHAVLGLGYQPGRYVNPGQQQGFGFPMGSIGAALLVAGVWAGLVSRSGQARLVLAAVGLLLLGWFFLTQQSRYLLPAVPPLAIMAGALSDRYRWGPALGAIIAAQAGYSFWLLKATQLDRQLPYVLGRQTLQRFYAQNLPFGLSAMALNELPKGSKVALYDQVFGFLLDVPYLWANPGHSTVIPYERLTASNYAATMASLGFTHVYVEVWRSQGPLAQQTLEELGFRAGPGFDAQTRASLATDLRSSWRLLVAGAARLGTLRPVRALPTGVLLEVTRAPDIRQN